MKRTILFLLVACSLGGCKAESPSAVQTPDPLTISAAASLKDAFTEIGKRYQSQTGREVNFNFGASGTLQKQIENGAPVDIFASAGARQMDELEGRGFILNESRLDFARNSLVLIVPEASHLTLANFADLESEQINKIAIGNSKTVPAGQYTEQVFDYFKLHDRLRNRLIAAEDVRQVLDYVIRGEVDAGIVYATDAGMANTRVRVVATAPQQSHTPILYPIAIIKESPNRAAAQAFVNLLLSQEGQEILHRYGFNGANNQ
jgi:molybdate transport system substrate-binding protein